MAVGCVYLVGAGPGDPDLITVKGLKLIQQADVIMYDGLANPVLLAHAKSNAELVNVEKRPGFHRVQQDDINQMMVDFAQQNKNVVRLKGGDPIVFGRGGEEAEVLRDNGVAFEIVPGVTSAISAPAYAGIPVTHRGVSTHFTVVTGTTTALEGQHLVNWELLAQAGGTLLILMGTRNRADIAQRLIAGGREPETTVTAIYKGTLPGQKSIRTTLENLGQTPIDNPSVIVVGPVAGMDLAWFEKRPLLGKTIAVTRARTQSSDLVDQLNVLGAQVIEVPTIEIAPIQNWEMVDQVINSLAGFGWVIFTSTNGVSMFFDRIFQLGLDVRVLAGRKIAAIGNATTRCVESFHLNVDLEPETGTSEGILAAFEDRGSLDGVKILIPGPESRRSVLPKGLKELGAEVQEVVVYKTVKPKGFPERFNEAMSDASIDLVTFTSSSTVTNMVDMVSDLTLLQKIRCACIGPITAQTARSKGLEPVVSLDGDDISIPNLVAEIVAYFNRKEEP